MAGVLSLTKANEIAERAKGAMARVRESANKRAKKLQRLGIGLVAAYAFGAWSKSTAAAGAGHAIPTIAGLNSKLVWGLAAYLGGEMLGGSNGEVLEDAGFGVLCAYAHEMGSTG